MHITNLRKVGGSVMVTVPPAFLDLLGLKPGSMMGVTVDKGRLVLEPQPRRKYTLDELLANCDPAAVREPEEQEWLDDSPVGRELL